MDQTNPSQQLDETRPFKFQVPAHLHVRLHENRLLTGESISSTVSAALEQYFDKVIPDDAAIGDVADLSDIGITE